MIAAIKALIGSKKFWMTIAGSAVVAALAQFGLPHDVVFFIGGLFGVNVGAQGLADFGKSKTPTQ